MSRQRDPELERLLRLEDDFYLNSIDLIAASNAPTEAVRSNAQWGVAQFRSAEGYAGRRPYAGTDRLDALERLAVRRACDVFAAEHANVQPLSGSLANLAAYHAVLEQGDVVLSMAVDSGGHLSHGHPLHAVSTLYRIVRYGVRRDSGLIDYEELRTTARRVRPRLIVAGYSAYPRTVEFGLIAGIAADVGAYLLADISHIAGLVAAGLHPNPAEVGAIVSTSVEKTLRGTRGGLLLCPAELAGRVDRAVFPGLQSSVGAAGLVSLCAVLFEASTSAFVEYQKQTVLNAQLLARLLAEAGVPVLTGGTDTHMVVLNVKALGLSGRKGEQRLESVGILSNRNVLPYDTLSPFVASGLRLGTPTVTSRGFTDNDIRDLAGIVASVLTAPAWNAQVRRRTNERVRELATRPRSSDSLDDLDRARTSAAQNGRAR